MRILSISNKTQSGREKVPKESVRDSLGCFLGAKGCQRGNPEESVLEGPLGGFGRSLGDPGAPFGCPFGLPGAPRELEKVSKGSFISPPVGNQAKIASA